MAYPKVLAMPEKARFGLDSAAEVITHDSRFERFHLLIVSDGIGEGAFVAEVAAHENRLGHVVERGDKTFATVDFMGDPYRLRMDSRTR